MMPDKPLPVRFTAACALQYVVAFDKAVQLIKGELGEVFKCYLDLMSQCDNEELVAAFEGITVIFDAYIAPFAVEICRHLKNQYVRLMQQD